MNYQKKSDENVQIHEYEMHTNFLTMISISLLLWNDVYPNEFMDDLEKISETLLSEK